MSPDDAIEAYCLAAIAEHAASNDHSASILAVRAAVVTLQDAREGLRAAFSAPPPDLAKIEQLVDAVETAAAGSGFGLKSTALVAARSALLAAIRSQVPADLAELLREHLAACEANGDPLGRRFESLDPKLAAWTHANLKDTP